MELRVLEYFLAIAREQSISAAAESLHLSQPTLSRQIKDMEEELGKQLLIRGNRQISLTEEGIILRKRAEEILDLVQKTENEITVSDDSVSGDVFIGTGESEGVRLLVNAGIELQKSYPDIHIHTVSGDSIDLMERLDKGLFDFAVLWDPTDFSHYESMKLPYKDRISLLLPSDCDLAKKDSVSLCNLSGYPLIASRQLMQNKLFDSLCGDDKKKLNIVGTYNLIYNASLMVEEGMGYAIGFDHIINTRGNHKLTYRPLIPKIEVGMNLVWKKYQVLTKTAQLFLEKVQELTPS